MLIFVIGFFISVVSSLVFMFLGKMEMAQYLLMWAITWGIVNLTLDS